MAAFRLIPILLLAIGLLCPALAGASNATPAVSPAIPADVSGEYDIVFSRDGTTLKDVVAIAQHDRKIVPERFFDKKDLGGGEYDPDSGRLRINVGDSKGELRLSGQCALEGPAVVCTGVGLFKRLDNKSEVELDFRMSPAETALEPGGPAGSGQYKPMGKPGRPNTDYVLERYKKTD